MNNNTEQTLHNLGISKHKSIGIELSEDMELPDLSKCKWFDIEGKKVFSIHADNKPTGKFIAYIIYEE